MWPNPQFPVDFATYTEEILNELYFLCSDSMSLSPSLIDYYGSGSLSCLQVDIRQK